MTSAPFEVPQEIRDSAADSVEQAKKAFDQFLDATGKAMQTGEGASRAAADSAGDMSRQTMAFMQESMSASFDLAQRIVQARTMEEISALQQEFFRRQAASMARQGQDLGQAMARMAQEAAERMTKT